MFHFMHYFWDTGHHVLSKVTGTDKRLLEKFFDLIEKVNELVNDQIYMIALVVKVLIVVVNDLINVLSKSDKEVVRSDFRSWDIC